ncbi:MAG TPA: septal ring lytic transglycosylase RlpA family protein [Xanthobacteraceae bacterium]|nr:septal ring lytic transglycosylase RlpA family protein [Xanthobacteraceae bacterium]
MNLRSIVPCIVAGTILATTMGTANAARSNHGITATHHRGHAAGQRISLKHHHHWASHRSHHGRVQAVARLSHEDQPSASGRAPQSGIASVYSGERTANGEYASANRLTAAHRSLPFGTMVRVTHQGTGRSVVVRINDRGPFVSGRVIDLTPAGAHALGFSGLAHVTLTVIARG